MIAECFNDDVLPRAILDKIDMDKVYVIDGDKMKITSCDCLKDFLLTLKKEEPIDSRRYITSKIEKDCMGGFNIDIEYRDICSWDILQVLHLLEHGEYCPICHKKIEIKL